jgi:hypothetical protein
MQYFANWTISVYLVAVGWLLLLTGLFWAFALLFRKSSIREYCAMTAYWALIVTSWLTIVRYLGAR